MMNVDFTCCKSRKHFGLQVPGPDFFCEICFLRELAFVKGNEELG
jgi:hypothetical protein